MLFAVLILGIATGLMAQTVGVAFNNFEKITKKSDSADAYSGASTNGELYDYSDYSALFLSIIQQLSRSKDQGDTAKTNLVYGQAIVFP